MKKTTLNNLLSNKRFWIVPIFLLALLLVGMLLTGVLRQKWNYKTDNAAQQIARSYYKEPTNSLDVLFLGASTIRNGVSPLQLYHDYGISSVSRATSIQLPVVSLYYLKETMSTQQLKAVVIDATTLSSAMFDELATLSGKIHEAVDYMAMSKYKLQLIRELDRSDLDISASELLFPLYAYHDRWSELSKQDFTWRSWDKDYSYKGQYPTLRTVKYTYPVDYMQDDPKDVDKTYTIVPESASYFLQMKQICEDAGIPFIMVKMPSGSWSNYKHRLIQLFATQNNIPFLDLSVPDIQAAMEFDPNTDYCDTGRHPNITGAHKITAYLGDYLTQNYDFSVDRRTDPSFASWEEDYEKLALLLEDAELYKETNFIKFLSYLNRERYLTLIATRDDTARYFNDSLQSAFSSLGLRSDFADHSHLSYLAVIDGGVVVHENASQDGPVDYQGIVSNHNISLLSNANQLTNNNVEIKMDGEVVGTNGRGFNILVYDKDVDQIVANRAFATGLNGNDYQLKSTFGLSDDLLEFFDLLPNEDYISVMFVSGEGSRYMPGVVNDKLKELGLIPLDQDFNRPYIAVMDGPNVVFNEYGDPATEINTNCVIGGVDIVAVSSALPEKRHAYVSVGESEFSRGSKQIGLSVVVYSKEEQRVIANNRFDWRNNYYAPQKINGITNVLELIKATKNNAYHLLCLYNTLDDPMEFSPDQLTALHDLGLSKLGEEASYVGLVSPDGHVEQHSSSDSAKLQTTLNDVDIELLSEKENSAVHFDNIAYSAAEPGLYLFVYDANSRTVLTQVRYKPMNVGVSSIFEENKDDPLSYLDLLDSEDYITIMIGAREASRYMPGVVNEKLESMGLLPLNREIGRPYVAILNGSEVVFNEYGEPGSEISVDTDVDGTPIVVISNSMPARPSVFLSVGDEEPKNNLNPGFLIYVYSKAEQRKISYVRFNWSKNYLSHRKAVSISSPLELITVAKKSSYDVICLYNAPAGSKGLSDTLLRTLQDHGFTELDPKQNYAGLVCANGETGQKHGQDAVDFSLDLNSVPLALHVDQESAYASFLRGAKYEASAPGLYLILYDPAVKAVLCELHYPN